MQIIHKKMPDSFNLFLFSCQHIGNVLSSNKLWDKLCNMFRSEFQGCAENFALDHGDCIEAIETLDKRFDLQTVDVRLAIPLAQAQEAIKQRSILAEDGRLITVLKGNHEHRLTRIGNMTEHICSMLEVPYGTYCAVVQYYDKRGRLMWKHFAQHGAGALKSVAEPYRREKTNRQIALVRKFKHKMGDCLLNSTGHYHQLIPVPPDPVPYVVTSKTGIKGCYTKPSKTLGYIEPYHRWYVSVGSFLKTYGLGLDGYAERAGYDPVELGFMVVPVRDQAIQDIVTIPLEDD